MTDVAGKVYYDVTKARGQLGKEGSVAVARVEQLSPFPYDLIRAECAKYPNAQIVWAQEEHKNMGAWDYVHPRFNTLFRVRVLPPPLSFPCPRPRLEARRAHTYLVLTSDSVGCKEGEGEVKRASPPPPPLGGSASPPAALESWPSLTRLLGFLLSLLLPQRQPQPRPRPRPQRAAHVIHRPSMHALALHGFCLGLKNPSPTLSQPLRLQLSIPHLFSQSPSIPCPPGRAAGLDARGGVNLQAKGSRGIVVRGKDRLEF